MRYPEITPNFLPADTPIKAAGGKKIAEIKDFWQWAYSNLIDNTVRGKLAEFLVACALGIEKTITQPWAEFDLLSNEGVSIEVKTSGYIQAWGQNELSRLSFGIPQTHGWDGQTGKYSEEKKRQADVYVFCVHNHTVQETLNPLDVTQWDFYVLPTTVLNEKACEQRSIALSTVVALGAKKCTYELLHEEIQKYAR